MQWPSSLLLLSLVGGSLAGGKCLFPDIYNPLSRKCYSVVRLSAPWTEALTVCKIVGGEVVTPESAVDNSQLAQYVKDAAVNSTWLGARLTIFNKVLTAGGKLLNFSKWAPGQPDKRRGDCVKMGSDSYWYSEKCDSHIRFFCKYHPHGAATTTTVRTSVTDGRTTSQPTKTDIPLTPDSTATVTPEHTEDPASAETGSPVTHEPVNTEAPATDSTTEAPLADSTTTLPNATEPSCAYKSFSNPCPLGFVFYQKTCSCYLLSYVAMNWQQAENFCRANSAHLTSIHSREEARFVTTLAATPGNLIHVGLAFQADQWTWVDGTVNDYRAFAPRQPSGNLKRSACGALYGNGYYYSSYLTNQPCSAFYYYSVCKKALV